MTWPPRAVTATSAAHRSSWARRMSVAVVPGDPSSSTTSPAKTTVIAPVSASRCRASVSHDRPDTAERTGGRCKSLTARTLASGGTATSSRSGTSGRGAGRGGSVPSRSIATCVSSPASSNDAPGTVGLVGVRRAKHPQLTRPGHHPVHIRWPGREGHGPFGQKRFEARVAEADTSPTYGTRRVRPSGGRGGRHEVIYVTTVLCKVCADGAIYGTMML